MVFAKIRKQDVLLFHSQIANKRLKRINKGKKERHAAFCSSYSSVAGKDHAKVCLLPDTKEK
jgi:hypothetical protein